MHMVKGSVHRESLSQRFAQGWEVDGVGPVQHSAEGAAVHHWEYLGPAFQDNMGQDAHKTGIPSKEGKNPAVGYGSLVG